jgi:hypothetical protein
MEILCDNGDYLRKEGTPHPNASKREEYRNEEDCFAEIGVRYGPVLCGRLSGPLGTTVPHLHIVELGFECFYRAVGNFQIFVEPVALGNKLKEGSGGIRD